MRFRTCRAPVFFLKNGVRSDLLLISLASRGPLTHDAACDGRDR
jgi:hypothetical protein